MLRRSLCLTVSNSERSTCHLYQTSLASPSRPAKTCDLGICCWRAPDINALRGGCDAEWRERRSQPRRARQLAVLKPRKQSIASTGGIGKALSHHIASTTCACEDEVCGHCSFVLGHLRMWMWMCTFCALLRTGGQSQDVRQAGEQAGIQHGWRKQFQHQPFFPAFYTLWLSHHPDTTMWTRNDVR